MQVPSGFSSLAAASDGTSAPPRRRGAHQQQLIRALEWLLILLSVAMVLEFVWSALGRVRYPYDINDTGMLQTVQHIAAGEPLYAAPDIHFIPFLYTPLFYYASLGAAKIVGLDYAALRSVSIVSTLLCLGVIYAFVFRETRRHLPSFAAMGAFASCYSLVLQWFDIGRVDMLWLLFVLLALYVTRRGSPAFAALLWVCAFQTKQGVLPLALLALAHNWQRPRRVVLGLGTLVIALLGSMLWLDHVSHGWYHYYVFGLVGGLGFDQRVIKHLLSQDLLQAYGVALLVLLAALLYAPPHWRSRTTAFWAATFVGMVLPSLYLRAHRGAATNSLLPAYLWISIALGVALARLAQMSEELSSRASTATQALLLTAVCLQLLMHLYAPHDYRPSPYFLGSRDSLVAGLRALPGDVLVFSHPEDTIRAGKTEYAHGDAIGTIIDAGTEPYASALIQQLNDKVHQRAFSAIVLNTTAETVLTSPRTWMPRDFRSAYPLLVRMPYPQDPDLGAQPAFVYLPCSSASYAHLFGAIDTGVCNDQRSPAPSSAKR